MCSPEGGKPTAQQMDMHLRDQYPASLRQEYRRSTRKQRTRLLDEARKRTGLPRKVLIRKLAHPTSVAGREVCCRGKTCGAAMKGAARVVLGGVRLPLPPAAGVHGAEARTQLWGDGSFSSMIRFTGSPVWSWRMPLGQSISTRSIFVARPSPKWSRKSLCEI